ALLEHFDVFDYVFIGEADEIFADVCGALLRDGEIPPEKFPYGLWSRRVPKPKNLIHRVTKNIETLPVPDFADFFATYKELFPERNSPYLMVEGSRGCWWAQHKPCTFCGLNGFARGYREKSVDRLADEIKLLSETYPDAEFCLFADSILSQRQTKELPAALKARKVKLKFFTEIKSNLGENEISALAEVGFFHLQPGIESLQDDMLRIMNKGCRAIKQIETLKFYRTYNMIISWNLLVGFPGEREEYVAQIVELMPLIMHLESPNQIIHIVYHRYGEYTENPERYGLSIRPPRVCDFAFADRDFIKRTTYFFEPTDKDALAKYYGCQRMGAAYAEAKKIIDRWLKERSNPQRLDMYDAGNEINIFDMRNVAVHSAYKLIGLRAQLYRACRCVQSEKSLAKKFPDVPAEKIHDELVNFCADKIMINIGDEYLALAVDANPKVKKFVLKRGWLFDD
ncbi:MAG: RiPP maturation radical SAM C-methyltransferase, partial [Selenomonadaceae bacterium]|nr:RiPP maturation radical SAM C-methyltransferase [Selenomonadaceae bacterium]